MKPIPYKFKSNEWSKERYRTNELLNSHRIHDPVGIYGSYKTNDAYTQVQEIDKYLHNKRNAIDIGCRWGSFAVQLHKIGFNHVHMVEMRELHFNGISYNVDLSRATVYNFAAMDKTGYVSRAGKKVTNIRAEKIVTNNKRGNVRSHSIDDLEVENVDFIKIDVDGPDRLVLSGGIKTNEKYKPIIYIEYGLEQ